MRTWILAASLGIVGLVPRLAAADRPCVEPRAAQARWNHRHRTPLVVSQGSPRHSAKDPIVLPGEVPTLSGKFAYGVASIDLQEEEVVVFVRLVACGPWREVARGATDRDGRYAFSLPAGTLPSPGQYSYRMVVAGDGSFAEGSIWVVAPGARAVVFDIDGTLTQGDEEMIREILLGATPRMYDGAREVARAWATAGYQPIYLTGRPYLLTATSRRWLGDQGFPPGPVITADSLEDAAIGRDHVGRYKREVLLDLSRRTRLDVAWAYGNADTDICAYAEAGISPDRTFIIGPLAGRRCDARLPTRALTDYPSHLPTIARLARAR